MDSKRREFLKANLVLPALTGGAGLATSALANAGGNLAASASAGPVGMTEAEKLAGVSIVDSGFPPGNVRRYGAVGDGGADDTASLQAAFDAAQAANFSFPVYLPTGDYVINSPLRIRGGAPKSLVLVGDGGAFGIRNTRITAGSRWSGDSMIQADGKRKNGWTITDVWFDARTRARCILDLRELNYLTLRGCRFAGSTGTVDRHGLAAVIMENGWVTRIENCVFAECGDGLYTSISTNNLNVWGCSFVGNKGIGFRARGCYSVNISGSVFEDNEQTGILLDICRSVWISGNYFEMNGRRGYEYRKGDKRTVRADIIANGWVSPEMKSKDPCKGIGVFGNYFMPPNEGSFDSSIYLIAVDGFTEAANEVHKQYPVPAAFIKTRNFPGLYKAANLTLSNSFVQGLRNPGSRDQYLEVAGLNDERVRNYDVELGRTLSTHPVVVPRFNAHEDLGLDPLTYRSLSDLGGRPVISRTDSLRMGRPVYQAELSTNGSSDLVGATIPESAYQEFWAGRLWMAYLEVQGIDGSVVFEIEIGIGDRRYRNGGRVSTSGGFDPRIIIFKPVQGTDFRFGLNISGSSPGQKVAFSRPVICPLGAMHELHGPYAS